MANRKEVTERIKIQQHWVDGGDVVAKSKWNGVEGLVGDNNTWDFNENVFHIEQTPTTIWICKGVDQVFQTQDEVDQYCRNRLSTYTCTQYDEVIK